MCLTIYLNCQTVHLHQMIRDKMRKKFVLPNVMYVPLTNPVEEGLDLTALKHPGPVGVLYLQQAEIGGLTAGPAEEAGPAGHSVGCGPLFRPACGEICFF